MTDVVVDTHVLLWWFGDRSKLSNEANRFLNSPDHMVLISPISFWEVGMLRAKGRIDLDRPTSQWANDVLGRDGVSDAALTSSIAVAATELGDFHGDPADRILVATALDGERPLITKDQRIRQWADTTNGLQCLW